MCACTSVCEFKCSIPPILDGYYMQKGCYVIMMVTKIGRLKFNLIGLIVRVCMDICTYAHMYVYMCVYVHVRTST